MVIFQPDGQTGPHGRCQSRWGLHSQQGLEKGWGSGRSRLKLVGRGHGDMQWEIPDRMWWDWLRLEDSYREAAQQGIMSRWPPGFINIEMTDDFTTWGYAYGHKPCLFEWKQNPLHTEMAGYGAPFIAQVPNSRTGLGTLLLELAILPVYLMPVAQHWALLSGMGALSASHSPWAPLQPHI